MALEGSGGAFGGYMILGGRISRAYLMAWTDLGSIFGGFLEYKIDVFVLSFQIRFRIAFFMDL